MGAEEAVRGRGSGGALVVAMAVLLVAGPAKAQAGIAAGDKAPIVTVHDLDGNAELLPTVKAAAERYGRAAPGRPLWDEGETSRKAYEVPGTSYVMIIDAKGTVVYTGFGGKQDFEKALQRAQQR